MHRPALMRLALGVGRPSGYSPKCLEGSFPELRAEQVLGSSTAFALGTGHRNV